MSGAANREVVTIEAMAATIASTVRLEVSASTTATTASSARPRHLRSNRYRASHSLAAIQRSKVGTYTPHQGSRECVRRLRRHGAAS